MTRYINIDLLQHHPNNPRKEIGDITELAESIKAQGLIQSLCVIEADENKYYVIAGNRRLEACKLAGLEMIPCEVVDIDDEAAIGIMLTENILRQNLTTFEESQGFQLMLDMGRDVDQIAKGTGMKAENVKLRTKLNKLDKENLQKACDAGATLFELAAVADIEDEKEREKLLKKAGTKDFNNAMLRMKQEKAAKERMLSIECYLRDHEFEEYTDSTYDDGYISLLIKDENGEVVAKRGYMKFVTDFTTFGTNMPEEFEFDPEVKYCFYNCGYGFKIYRDLTPEEYEADKAKQEQDRIEREERAALQDAAYAIEARHQQLREDFVLNFVDFKKHQKDLKVMAVTALDKIMYNNYGLYKIKETVEELMQKIDPNSKDIVDRTLLLRTYAVLEGGSCFDFKWVGEEKTYKLFYKQNENLDRLYAFLINLGYVMSEEEEQIIKGTHPIFEKVEEKNEDNAGDNACN